ncbi:hypothetical protein JVU11DRAFT_6345 [Chiua virens]|nr:hypothetical protein JVU11DRAFT_6345 [Chiua virens]
MDNPWATSWDENQSTLSSSTSKWPPPAGTVWQQGCSDPPWESNTVDTTSEQDERGVSPEPDAASVSDHQLSRPPSPSAGSSDPVPDSTDATLHDAAPGTPASVKKGTVAIINPSDNGWTAAWGTTSPSEPETEATQPPDQWETARQEKEKLNRAVPPELLEYLLCHCQQVSQEIWPASESETSDEGNWRSGFDDLSDIATLLVQLAPPDSTLPPTVQFSETATAKAMNEALKLTRNLPESAASPLSRLLASKGSLEWEKSIKAKQQDIVPDTTHVAHVGWRVLEKEDRLVTTEDSKPKRATSGGLLSFWSRRVSTIQASPVETPRERSNSPARSSVESVKSVPYPSSSRAASPSKAAPVVPLPPPADSHPAAVATAPAPSVVSRFLNRFSRAKGNQHSVLALSSDDIEFLSDIVPSASDPPDEDINGSALETLTAANDSSSLPPKLPPPIPPPPKQPVMSSHPLTLALGTMDGVGVNGNAAVQMQPTNHTPDIPVLAPPLSPRPADSFSYTRSPPLSLKGTAMPTVLFAESSVPLSLPPKAPSSLSIPPLLPPPPFSPPQTPRPSIIPPMAAYDHSSAMRSNDTSSFHDSYDSDDDFSAFTSFPPSNFAPFPSSNSYPSKRSPSPPSPPPRRTYERTHYPSSSSISSTLSPGSHASADQLYSTGSLISTSLDSFDDFVSPPSAIQSENRKHTPSPPPLPVKPQFQHRQPPRIDTYSTRVYHAHTPSQTFASPTVRTGLLNGSSSSTVSHAQHQRTQSLVSQAAARGGLLWPNSPDSDESKAMTIPLPPSSFSPKPLIGKDTFDLLGDDDALGGGLEALPASLSIVGGTQSPHPPISMSRTPFGVVGSPGQGLGVGDQLQPSSPPLPSTSMPILLLSSLGAQGPLATGPSQPTRPKQTGGLSAQDLSFFEGL